MLAAGDRVFVNVVLTVWVCLIDDVCVLVCAIVLVSVELAVGVFVGMGDLVYDGDAVVVFELLIEAVAVFVVSTVDERFEVIVKLGLADCVFD